MGIVKFEVSDGLQLVADEMGDPGARPVLLLHGAGQNRHAWKNTAAVLADQDWFVVATDARGHGDSDWSTHHHYDMDHTGADVLALVGRFESPPVVIGASMGGMSALAAQLQEPTRQLFEAVVLVDIAPGFAVDGASRIVNWMGANPNGFASLQAASDAMAAYNPNRPKPKSLEGLKKVLRQSDDGRWHWRWDPNYILSKPGFGDGDQETMQLRMKETSEKMMAGAKAIEVPLLLVRGGKSDLVTLDSVQAFLDEIPTAEFVDVANTGHMVAGDDNDAFTSAVIEFLDRAVDV